MEQLWYNTPYDVYIGTLASLESFVTVGLGSAGESAGENYGWFDGRL